MRPISIDSSDKEREFLGLVSISFFPLSISEFSLKAKLWSNMWLEDNLCLF